MIKNNGKFVIKFEERDKEFVENMDWKRLNEGYNKAKNFFISDEDIFPIKICFVYSPEEYLFFSGGQNFKKWNVACARNKHTIYIFSPSVVEKYTIHKKDHFYFTLLHEISHFFYRQAIDSRDLAKFSLWNEGIAEYIADRRKPKSIDSFLSTLVEFLEDPTMDYKAGHLLVDCIMSEFGSTANKKIIQFLMETDEGWTEKDLFRKFEEIFGVDANKLIELQKEELKNETFRKPN